MNSAKDIIQDMQSLMEASEAMLAQAKNAQWDELVESEAKRRPALEAFFASLSDETRQQYADQIRQFIQTLLKLDQEVMSLSGKAKLDAAQDMQKLQAASKAAKMYSDNQG